MVFPENPMRIEGAMNLWTVFLKQPKVFPDPPSLESVNFRLILVTHTQIFGPHTPVPLDLCVYPKCVNVSCVPLCMHKHTYPFLFLVHA